MAEIAGEHLPKGSNVYYFVSHGNARDGAHCSLE